MNIKNIKETSCPDCGCREVVEERINARHCSGHHNEYRLFDCGMRLHFSPNFMQTRPDERCLESVAFVKQKKDRVKAINSLEKYVGKMKVDEKFKEMILDKFTYIYYDI